MKMTKFVYENIKLIHGDCMNYMKDLPDNAFDLSCVDPPYGLGDINQTRSRKLYKKIIWNNKIPDKQYFDQLYRISINQIIWGANYFYPYIKESGRLIHDKTGHGKKNQLKELSDADIASHSFGNNIKIFHYIWQGNVQGNSINWKNLGEDARIHPTQKPIALYKWLLKNYAKETDRIIDTHLGSGSSAIAAWEYKSKEFVGIEIDREYYDAAVKRFKNHVAQLKTDFK